MPHPSQPCILFVKTFLRYFRLRFRKFVLCGSAHFTEPNISCEAESRSASQEIAFCFGSQKFISVFTGARAIEQRISIKFVIGNIPVHSAGTAQSIKLRDTNHSLIFSAGIKTFLYVSTVQTAS
jgi:hypothetical protein